MDDVCSFKLFKSDVLIIKLIKADVAVVLDLEAVWLLCKMSEIFLVTINKEFGYDINMRCKFF